MKKYHVTVSELADYRVEVEADSPQQAKAKALEQHSENFSASQLIQIPYQQVTAIHELPNRNTK